jgi:hypothetical protein
MLAAAAVIASTFLPPQDSGPAFSGRARQLAVAIPRADTTIVVDGVLDEPVWARAARLVDFSQYQPTDGLPAAEATEVLVWYAPGAIHFGIRAHEAHGDVVRATRADRDNIGADDYVQILLDTYHDGRRAFLFGVNPFGVQQDGTRSDQFSAAGGEFRGGGGVGNINPLEGNVDLNPDFVFESRGRLVSGGYEVEVRIPFKSLRYQSGTVQTWGIHVLRRVQHSGYQDSWAPVVRASASFIGQAGSLQGLRELHRGLVLEVTPFATGRLDGARPEGGRWHYHDQAELGLNARWGLTQNLSLDATVNPDFSQVEADVGQVTINERFALFFPEKRPFFLEGLELFDSPNRLIHTRRIVSPDAGVKLAGKVGATNVAVLLAADDTAQSVAGHHPVFAVTRLRRDLGPASTIGLVSTLREDGADYSRLVGTDLRIVHSRLYFVQLQAVGSWSRAAGRTTGGGLFQAMWDRTGRSWGFNYSVTAVAPNFQAAAGFVNRTGIASADFFNRLTAYGARGSLVETATAFIGVSRVLDYRRFALDSAVEGGERVNWSATLRGGGSLGGSFERDFFTFDLARYAGYQVEAVRATGRDTIPFYVTSPLTGLLSWSVRATTPTYRAFTASVSMGYGAVPIFDEAGEGREYRLGATLDWRPARQVRVAFQYTKVDIGRTGRLRLAGRRFSSQSIPRLKVEYQAGRALFVRFVGQYTATRRAALVTDSGAVLVNGVRATAMTLNDIRVDWLFSYRPSPGTLLYLGYGASLLEPEAFALSREELRRVTDGFFGKVSYLFRL